MTAALLAVFVLHSTPQNQGQVSPPPQEAPLVLPASPVMPAGFKIVKDGGGRSFYADENGIGPAVIGGGLWSDLTNKSAGERTSRIRVFVQRDMSVVKSVDGGLTSDRTTIWPDQLISVKHAAQMVGFYAGSLAEGAVKVQAVISDDADPIYFKNSGEAEIGQWFVENVVNPRVNSSKFESDDPTDYGPFDLTVVVVSGGLKSSRSYLSRAGKVLVLPYYDLRSDALTHMANEMLGAWLKSPAAPKSLEGHRQVDGTVVLTGNSDGAKILENSALSAEFIPSKGASKGLGHWTGKPSGDGFMEWLGLAPQSEDLTSWPVWGAVGDFKVKPEDEGYRVTRTSRFPSGSVKVGSASGTEQSWTIRGKIKSNSAESWGLGLISGGSVKAKVQLSGASALSLDEVVIRAQVPFDGEWHDFVAVTPTMALDSVHLGPFESSFKSRFVPEDEYVMLKDITVAAAAEGDSTSVSALPSPADAFVAEFRDCPPSLPGGKWGSVKDAFESKDVELEAVTVELFTRVKSVEALPYLVAAAASANDRIVPIAVEALVYQDSPEAWSALRTILEKGPFPLNRKAAWSVLKDQPKDGTWSKTATALSLQASWELRRISVDLWKQVPSEQSGIAILTGFQDFDPAVRMRSAELLDPSNELNARRLIFMGVNDASEAVRTACLLNLLDCPIDRFRLEAHKGVRDESVSVRLALLEAAADRKDSSDRPMLQLAVTDKDSDVVAAALRAYIGQPEAVTFAEIKSASNLGSLTVMKAMLNLAIAKKIALPDDLVSTYRAVDDVELNRLLDRLKGGQ